MTTISHATGPTDRPLLGTTIGTCFDDSVARFPHREALVDVPSGRRWTYQQLGHDVDVLARALLAAGIAVGDRVGIWAPNCPEWFLVQFATAKVGAILVTLNPAYRSHELRYALNQSGIRLLFTPTSFKSSAYRAMVEEVAQECPALERTVFIGSHWEAFLGLAEQVGADRLAAVQADLHPDDPINIQYTSGTTGSPKGATLSHRNILNNGFFVGEGVRYTHEDRICVPVPFYHCFGMVMGNLGSVTHGACVVIPAASFDATATLKACADERCTSLYGVPTMFIGVLAVPDFEAYDLSAMRTAIMAGASCPVEVMKRVSEWAPDVAICYGMTETSPASTQTLVDDTLERRVATVGRAHPHVEVAVVDPVTGQVVPRGVAGEMLVRGYLVMLGYWDDPEKTAEAVDADGWMHTGDIAVMDQEGYLSITGRIKDLVIRGGENVSPREVEEFLYLHPDVLDAQVIGVPDERYGEELMVWIRMRDGAVPLDAASVKEFCEGRLARHKVPRYVHVVDDFPMTVTGKVRKVEMREQAIALLAGHPIAHPSRSRH